VDFDFGGDFEAFEGLVDHLPGGVALGAVGFGAGNAAMVGGEEDRCLCCASGCNRHEIMELERLIDGGQGVKTVRAEGADGEA
jgi:hypothetical protein